MSKFLCYATVWYPYSTVKAISIIWHILIDHLYTCIQIKGKLERNHVTTEDFYDISASQKYICCEKASFLLQLTISLRQNTLKHAQPSTRACLHTVPPTVCHPQTPRWYMHLHWCCDSLPAWLRQTGDSASLSSADNQRVNMPKWKWVTWMSKLTKTNKISHLYTLNDTSRILPDKFGGK